MLEFQVTGLISRSRSQNSSSAQVFAALGHGLIKVAVIETLIIVSLALHLSLPKSTSGSRQVRAGLRQVDETDLLA